MYQKIPEQTYNSNIITYERIQQLDVNNLIDLLRGNIAGLQINYSDGQMKASIREVHLLLSVPNRFSL